MKILDCSYNAFNVSLVVQCESRKVDQSCNNDHNINNDHLFLRRAICVNRNQSWSWIQFHPGTGLSQPASVRSIFHMR